MAEVGTDDTGPFTTIAPLVEVAVAVDEDVAFEVAAVVAAVENETVDSPFTDIAGLPPLLPLLPLLLTVAVEVEVDELDELVEEVCAVVVPEFPLEFPFEDPVFEVFAVSWHRLTSSTT